MSKSVEAWRELCNGWDSREERLRKGCRESRISEEPWEVLDRWVGNHRERHQEREIWRTMERFPIDKDAIDGLIEDGWRIDQDFVEFACSLERKLITFDRERRGYGRDKAFFHEIVHAVYGEESKDFMGWFYEDENRAIVEWVARKCRANPELLRYAITSFRLEPHIYDKVSYLAFSMSPVDVEHQLAFPFGEERKRALSRVYMDRECTCTA